MRSQTRHAALLPNSDQAAALARAFTRVILEGRPGEQVQDAELLASELVTLGVRSGPYPVVLTIQVEPAVVIQAGTRAAAPVPLGPGWALVEAICHQSGIEPTTGRVTYWGRLPAPTDSGT